MKSFFKKLAFVMALAMVVSMAAPAAPVAYAAGELVFAMQDAKSADEAITSLNIAKVGDEADLRFFGAADGWQGNVKLVSTDPSVLTVTDNDYCKVKAVSEGRTTLTLTIVDQFVSIPVTVGNPGPEYIVEHKTADTIEVVFADSDHEYGKSDITLYRIYDGTTGDIRVNWPLESIESSEKGFIVKPYVTFQNEDKYVLTVGDEDVTAGEGFAFEINVGEPNRLVATYSCLNDLGKAYVDPETNEELPVKINVKYYYNDVDLTANYAGGPDTYFELAWASNEDAVSLDEALGNVYFSEIGVAAKVDVKYTYTDEYGDPHTITTRVDDIVSTRVTPYKVEGVVDWTIVKVGTAPKDVVWGDHDIPANDDGRNGSTDEYRILAVLLDNRGNYLVNDFATEGSYLSSLPASVAKNIQDSKGKIAAYRTTDNGYKFAMDGNVLAFSSANVYKMLVGTDGSLTTYTETKVPAIVSVVNETGERPVTKNVSALEVLVRAERRIDKIVLKNAGNVIKSINVVTDSTETKLNGSNITDEYKKFTRKDITIELYDQYNDPWHKNETIVLSSKTEGALLGIYDGTGAALTNNSVTYDATKKCAKIVVDGAKLEEKCTTDYPSFDFAIQDVKATAALKVTLKNPRYTDDTKTTIATSTNTIKLQATTPVDLKMMDSFTVTGGTLAGRQAYKTATISLTELSNTLEVGAKYGVLYYDGNSLYDENGGASKDATDGQYVVSVYGPKGNILPVATFKDDATSVKDKYNNDVYEKIPTSLGVINNGDGTLDVVLAYSASGIMNYADLGNYSVKVTAFDYYEKPVAGSTTPLVAEFWDTAILGTADWDYEDPAQNVVKLKFKSSVRINATVAVSNSSAKVTFDKMTDDVSEKRTAAEIVHELIDVKLAGKKWDFDQADIKEVYGRYNERAGYIIITAIEFKVPLNQTDAEKTGKDPVSYVQKIEVNKSVQVNSNFDKTSIER